MAYRDWLRKRNPLAIASAVLGIFSLIEFGALLVFGVAGTVLGVVALAQLRGPAGSRKPHGHVLALAGIITSVVSLVIAVWFVYEWV